MLLVTSCRKEFSISNPTLPDALTVGEAKLFYEQKVVVKEQNQNSKAAPLNIENVGIFKRMEKLGQKVQWDSPQKFAIGKILYLAFSLNEKDRELRTGNKMHRTFIFTKADGNIQMQICETMGTAMTSATILSQIKAALENHDMQKISAVSSGSSNLYFYNDSYRSISSFRVTHGKFENTAQTLQLEVVDNKGSTLASMAEYSNGQNCHLWGLIRYWWENGEYHEEILDTWYVCSPTNPNGDEELPDGGSGGEGGEPDLPVGPKLEQWIVAQNAENFWTVFSTEELSGIKNGGTGFGFFTSNVHKTDGVVDNGVDYKWTTSAFTSSHTNTTATTQVSGMLKSPQPITA